MPSETALAHIDLDWLSSSLRENGHADAEITHVDVEPLAWSGLTTDLGRLNVTYAAGGAGPTSMVAKARARDDGRKQVDAALGIYGRELRFYTDLAAEIPVRVPQAYAIGDGDANPLVLEDLSDHQRGDQVAGMSVADAELVLDALAVLHSRYWGSDTLELDWLSRPNDPVYVGMSQQLIQSGVPAFDDRLAPGLPAEVVADIHDATGRWQVVADVFVTGPHTLVHNDCRLDNLFMTADGTPIFIDWQTIAATRGSQDLANLLGGSMSASDLASEWERLLRRYHDGLTAGGVAGYSFDECVLHYRQNIIYPLCQGVGLMGPYGDSRGVGQKIVERLIGHVIELDSFGALKGN